MRIYIGSDHAGYRLKGTLKDFLKQEMPSDEVIDLGTFNEDSTDYPDIAREVSEKVMENHGARGILICGTGIGMCIAANRYKGVRAVDANTKEMAEMSRKHNDANVLCLGGRTLDEVLAKELTRVFLTTTFDPAERHVRRIKKMDNNA